MRHFYNKRIDYIISLDRCTPSETHGQSSISLLNAIQTMQSYNYIPLACHILKRRFLQPPPPPSAMNISSKFSCPMLLYKNRPQLNQLALIERKQEPMKIF